MTGKLWTKHLIRKVFLEDWGLKLVALAITFGLWFGVTGLSTPTTKRFTIPLNPSISNSTQITNPLMSEVDIVVSGDKRRIDQINKSELAATLDLNDLPTGERVVSLTPENVYVPLPQGIKLVEIQPGRIPVKLEAVEEKEVEVKVNTKGAPADGFEVYNSSALPPKIRVRGPASFTKKLEYVETDKIDLTGKKDEFTARQIAVTSQIRTRQSSTRSLTSISASAKNASNEVSRCPSPEPAARPQVSRFTARVVRLQKLVPTPLRLRPTTMAPRKSSYPPSFRTLSRCENSPLNKTYQPVLNIAADLIRDFVLRRIVF